jgi:DNA polymerase sigma
MGGDEIEEIYLDITIEDADGEDHFGKDCKDFVKQKIKENPPLRPVCLVLKKILKRFDLNKPYTGGLASYSLFLMLLAAHNEAK